MSSKFAIIHYTIADTFRSVISAKEGVKYADLRYIIMPDANLYLTDGNRIFKLKSHGNWWHTDQMIQAGDIDGIRSGIAKKTMEYLKNGKSFYDAHWEAFSDFFLYSYKEIFAQNIKIYVSEEVAEELNQSGAWWRCYKTLNGSRNKYLYYFSVDRDYLMYDSWDINQLKAM